MSDLKRQLEQPGAESASYFDAVIVGAGFAGLYMLHRLRELGLAVRVYEAGSGVGGTWFWNRYPGARCDVESLDYSYSFSEQLQQEWKWTERYPSQPEILRYLNHVADRFDLRRDIQLETRVTEAVLNEATGRWELRTDTGDRVSAKFCIMATGCLSVAKVPDIKGLESFQGTWYHTGRWPQEGVDFTGQRVGVIGTGSSGIQCIPVLAEQASRLVVFQRTPSFSVPACNAPLSPEVEQYKKANYVEYRRKVRESSFGADYPCNDKSALQVTREQRQLEYETRWRNGGPSFLLAFADLITNKDANETAVQFVHSKIRELVHDPAVAEALMPTDHALGTKRLCVDNNYYATFNRKNVTLVDIKKTPIEEITPKGLRTQGAEYELDSIVFATGFDAMTGALLNIDIRGKAGQTLKEKWGEGPRTYLGLMTAGFPNFFTITGPGSPSVLSNMIVSIEQHVEWIGDCINYLRGHAFDQIEATVEAEEAWVAHVNLVANYTLFPTANSWFLGANIPGKPRVFMPYIGGVGAYRKKCEDVAAKNYEGFAFSSSSTPTERVAATGT
ncbi:MAG TPA: NAD(P)/FAD-dependent oxidoreductase [Archangium sp.]|jgi:cyclohexanone monooxygenase|uniref:flavin-containing monooxygenase n=1 Tax=Archangium sp. TaxID=1872627 RepID=UPI002EDA17AD